MPTDPGIKPEQQRDEKVVLVLGGAVPARLRAGGDRDYGTNTRRGISWPTRPFARSGSYSRTVPNIH